MEYLFTTYKILVFLSFAFSSIMGGLILSNNSKAKENQIFAAVCTSLVFWIGGSLLSTVAPDIDTSLLWRRISALGWGTLYSILVHFFLVLCGEKRLLKKMWVFFIIYLPAAINLLVYSVLPVTAGNLFHLYKTELGWVNIPGSNVWDTFFNIYYLSFSLTILVILIRWGIKGNWERKKQVLVILAAYLSAIILGSISDIFLTKFIDIKIPSMAPIFIAIPMIAVYYEIRKFNLMKPDLKSDIADRGKMLSQAGQVRVYRFLSLLFILISLITFFLYLSIDTAGIQHVLFSIITFLIGSTLLYLPAIFNNSFHRDNLMIPTVNISVLSIMIHTSNLSFDQKMWPFPVLIILISIIFDKVYLLVSIAITSILANMFIWYRGEIPFDYSLAPEYLPRLVFFIVSGYLAINIRKLYLKRLKENELQVLFQQMISNITSKIVSINEDNADERLTAILKDFGLFYHADQAGLILFSSINQAISDSLTWCPEGEICKQELLKNYPEVDCTWLIGQLFNNEIVEIGNTDDLPAQAEKLRISFQKSLIKSHIAIPVLNKGNLIGILSLNFKKINTLKFNENTDRMLRIPSDLINDALMKIDSQKKINRLAYFDTLTGLPNRLLFQDRLETAMALAERSKKLVGVMMMDLDSFKTVNDSMGHDAGDLLLQMVSERLSHCIRQYDTMARFGGDEFLFILSQLNKREDAQLIADKILAALNKPIKLSGEEFFVTASLGISICPEDADTVDSIIKNSDLAMYESKKNGKHRYTFFNISMKDHGDKKMQLTGELFRAVEREEFILEYQPQVDTVNSKIIGMEALIRWNNPEKGLISPIVFIPLAEEVGLISEIGRWVLYTACRDNKLLQNKGFPPVRVAVNLSVMQFTSGDLIKEVRNALVTTGLAPEYLELEITESVAVGKSDIIIDTLKELRTIGVTVSIDDFGTEYSSLSRLKQLPIDKIKIDKQFIQGLSKSQNDESITSFIIQLSKNLGVKVIAEGVETKQQLAYLSENSCDEIQGYYFYKPLSLAALETAMNSI